MDEFEGCLITCEITSSIGTRKISVKLPAVSTVCDLIEQLEDRYSKPKDSFSLYFVANHMPGQSECENDEICLDDMGNERLNAFLSDTNQKVANFFISWHGSSLDFNAVSKNTENLEKVFANRSRISTEIISAVSMMMPPLKEASGVQIPDSGGSGLVGLVNQAMTCYLNSLLQSLFMTPEFRNAVYRWEFKGSPEEGLKSIPYQLQHLFLQLQTSKKKSIPTTNITQSFGWDNSEAWHQHDVQELCRVMFDALEKTWRDTDQADLINELYQGKMKDFIQCSECGWESTKYVAYQDIPLVVKPFDGSKTYASVEESLDGFCAPELLDGNNQWFCEKCQKKVDAKKCLKFKTFPYILTLHLMRFSFDYNSMRRIKLNDRVTFPEVLNLDRYVAEADLLGEMTHGEESNGESNGERNGENNGENNGANGFNGHRKESNDVHGEDQLNYDLFSIMIHSGNATGGHYYAYIRSFETGHWYNFDDQTVTKIDRDEIYKTYGGSSLPCNYYLPMLSSSTNAYMVMYRRRDKNRNAEFMKVEEFSTYLKEELVNMELEEEMNRKKQEMEKSICRIRIFVHHPIKNKLVESVLAINIYKTLRQATDLAWRLFELEDTVARDCVRLVQYDSEQDYIEQSFDQFEEDEEEEEGEYGTTVFELLGGTRSWHSFDLLLELKMPHETFQPYHLGEWVVKFHLVDLSREEVLPHHHDVRVNSHATVAEVFRLALAEANRRPFCGNEIGLIGLASSLCRRLNRAIESLKDASVHEAEDGVPSTRPEDTPDADRPNRGGSELHRVNLILQVKNDFRLLQDFQKQIKNEGFTKISKLYFECSGVGGTLREENFFGSKLYRFLHQQLNRITVKVVFEDGARSNEDVNLKCVPCPESNEKDADSGMIVEKENKHPSMYGDCGNGSESNEESTPSADFGCGGIYRCERPTYKDYFKVDLIEKPHWDSTKECLVTFDRRMKVKMFKSLIQSYSGIEGLEIYKTLTASCPNERLMRHFENFTSFENNSQLKIKAGRDLKKNEFLLKVYQLDISKEEASNFLYEFILTKGTTVAEVKKLLSSTVKKRDKIDVPPDRIRLRKKIWKNPTAVFEDDQKFDDVDLFITYNSEVFAQFLERPDSALGSLRFIFVRRWWPSKFQLDPVQEIVAKKSIMDFVKAISELSNISMENIQIAKVSGMFPNDTPLLDIHSGLVWMPHQSDESYPLDRGLESLEVYSDGTTFYYRDKTEDLKQLSQEERGLIQQKCKMFPFSSVSNKKEKPLKIYTEVNTSSSNVQANSDSPS